MNKNNIINNYIIENELDMEKIINEYSNYVKTVINNICGNYLSQEDIEEIILDVFLVLWKNKNKLDKDKNIKPYIASIAHNLTKKKMTSSSKNYNNVELDENVLLDVNIEDSFENKLKYKEIESIISELTNQDYTIFTLFYYNSLKTKQIAKKLGISNMKVKTRLHRIRLKIKKKLEERGYSI